jgi:cytochrome c oxidase subunit 3
MSESNSYYVPHASSWPFLATVSVVVLFIGAANYMNGYASGSTVMLMGLAFLFIVSYGWFSTVIQESEAGIYNAQVDISFRWGMVWFIFSEVMFFAAFFGALYYARELSLPWLGGDGSKVSTNLFLWPQFENVWPSNGPTNANGEFTLVKAGGIPAINTMLLLTSGLTVTWAHHGLKEQNRKKLIYGLAMTVLLGFTFYMLTGFHGFHVTLGAIMLSVILFRCMKGHFAGDNHFGFEAVAWYWHFVDVVWLGLFIFVYWL